MAGSLLRLFLAAAFAASSPFDSVCERGGALEQLCAGPPAHMSSVLPEQQYVAFEARRLARARLLWINRGFFREHDIPLADGPVPEPFVDALLDELAYSIPQKGEPEDAYLPRTKTFYADRYGGEGLGVNLGSGRAGSAGRLQLKGIGRTPLVRESGDGHSNGLVSLEEGMREVVYAELNQDLPLGGNRTVALIDRGIPMREWDGKAWSGRMTPSAIVVREDPLRPAHFLATIYGEKPYPSKEPRERFAERLAAALPVPEQLRDAPLGERISAGLSEYVDRLALQYAAAFARRMYHGATSESNVELSGRWLDFGTETALPDYGRVRILGHVAPAGGLADFRRALVRGFVAETESRLPKAVREALLRPEAFVNRFERGYDRALFREFLCLTGVRPELAGRLRKIGVGRRLARLLEDVATAGAHAMTVRHEPAEKSTRYDLAAILTSLPERRSTDPRALAAFLQAGPLPDPALSARLCEAYADFMIEARKAAAEAGIGEDRFWEETAARARELNREVPAAYRWNMLRENPAVIDRYQREGEPAVIRDSIDRRIAASRRKML